MSRADQIRRMGLQGRFLEYVAKNPRANEVEVAAALGASREYVRKAASRTGKSLPKVVKMKPVRFSLPGALAAQLDQHAELRGLSAEELASKLIRAVCDDNIVDAVLDDADEQKALAA
jgi:hypothetical protein